MQRRLQQLLGEGLCLRSLRCLRSQACSQLLRMQLLRQLLGEGLCLRSLRCVRSQACSQLLRMQLLC